jgi:protein TonB
MAGVRKIQVGELIALRPGAARSGSGAGAPTHPPAGNVVPFQRAQAPEVALPTDAARPAIPARAHDRIPLLAFAMLSLMAHAGLLLALSREPAPLASIGEQVISLEIVVGATAPAGVAQAPGEQEVQAAAAPEPPQPEAPREPEQKATEQPQTIQVAPEEKAPEQVAKAETPVEPEAVTERPKLEEETLAEPTRETEVAVVPPSEAKPPAPKAQSPKPVQHAAPARERRRIGAPTREHATKQAKASAPSSAANNVGVGRSDANSNYAGIVSAHLRRHQQYPGDARSRGEQGTATVSFSLDGGGRVTSARLVRGSGIASIDQEVQAMVRRSSPFPVPPSGRGVSFTVPVSFRLN